MQYESIRRVNYFLIKQVHYSIESRNEYISQMKCMVWVGLTNSVNFTEIRQIRSPPNFKIRDFTVHGFEIFER
jgi:hypothetical protein